MQKQKAHKMGFLNCVRFYFTKSKIASWWKIQ